MDQGGTQSIKRILIVEDEKPMAKALGFKLTHNGVETTVVYDGEEALAALAQEKFSLILLDLVMPKKGGIQVLEEMRKRGDNTPVIILSNLSDEHNRHRAAELGAADYLVKSSTPIAEVLQRINNAIVKQ